MKRLKTILACTCFVVLGVACSQSGTEPQTNIDDGSGNGGGGSGGGGAATPCGTVSASAYSTGFAVTENPISEGGRWVNGKTDGVDWNDVQTVPGKAYAADFVGGGSRYNDPIAHLNASFRTFASNQYAEGIVFRAPGYRNPDDKHEVELLLRFEIAANSARGYEVLWGQDGEIFVVRWNGPLGNYTTLGGVRDPGPGPAVDGDVLRAEIVGNEITVCKNGDVVIVVSDPDSTWVDGQPGIGFWPTAGSTLEDYGWMHYEAGDL